MAAYAITTQTTEKASEFTLEAGATYSACYEASTGAQFYRTNGSGVLPADFPAGFYASQAVQEITVKTAIPSGEARYVFTDSSGAVWVGYKL